MDYADEEHFVAEFINPARVNKWKEAVKEDAKECGCGIWQGTRNTASSTIKYKGFYPLTLAEGIKEMDQFVALRLQCFTQARQQIEEFTQKLQSRLDSTLLDSLRLFFQKASRNFTEDNQRNQIPTALLFSGTLLHCGTNPLIIR